MSNLQAVVLAGGKGNRLELVGSDTFDIWDDCERALLPLAGIPLFWYPLNVLARNNIKEVLLITNGACLEKIKKLLKDGSLPELPELKIDVVAPPAGEDEEDEEYGSAEVLRMFSDRLTRDFILLTGYFVSDISFHKMIEKHYENSSVLTCLLSDKTSNFAPPGPKNQQSYKDFIGICEKTNQLLYLQSEEELDIGVDSICVRNALDLTTAKCIELTSSFVDCHVYLMDHRLLNVLNSLVSETENFSIERAFSSLKVDVIPYLLERQYKNDQGLQALFERSDLQLRAYNMQTGDDDEPTSLFRIFGYKSTPDVATVIGKCNTLGAYLETNKAVLEMKKPLLSIFAEPTKYPGTKVNVIKSRIDASSKIGESELSIVKSSVGKDCNISKSVKVEESIVMDGAKIDSGCQLKRCVVGRGAQIGQGCKLQNCVIEPEHIVNPKTTASDTFLQSEKEWQY